MTSIRAKVQAVIKDPDAVRRARKHFPALDRRHNGHPVAYFDGPRGTQVPRQVADAMTQYLFHHNANTHWVYPTSEETDALIAASRRTVAAFLNAEADEIAFGANMTTLTFHLARALGRGWKAGDEVVVTELDHHANVAPWRALEKERGIVIRTVRFDPRTGRLDIDDLEAKLTSKTRLLALGVASNALGTITNPTYAGMARKVGAQVFIDAVHYAPHALVDVKAWDCDFLACSAYKFYGPHIGVLYGKKSRIEALDFPKLEPAPNESPERVETGTQNHEGIVGAAAAVEFIASLGQRGSTLREKLETSYQAHFWHGKELLEKLWSGLGEIPGVTLYGPQPEEERTPTLSFTLKGHATNDIARALAKKGMFVSNGDFYAMTVIERIGQAADGVVRVGCSCYTTEEEVDRVIEGVREIARGR
jgi:cysteine desulfurase family protein (TIGR01976 family)